MAERRMFAMTIIDSDAFLDMELSAQALYFHLCMRSDDDGFLNNPKKLQRVIGASESDLEQLIDKRFLIAFPSGVVVIKHWLMHNRIKKDRYKPTVYTSEKLQLSIKENGSYTEVGQSGDTLENNWNTNGDILDTEQEHDVSSLEPQDSISIRLGKVSKDNNTLSSKPDKKNYQYIVDGFNSICISLPKVLKITDKRKTSIKSLLAQYSEDEVTSAFIKAQYSDFLTNRDGNGWMCSFDWIINKNNFVKVLEGNYDNKNNGKDSNSRFVGLTSGDTTKEMLG